MHARADEAIYLEAVPITANPLSLSNDEMVHPIYIVGGSELERKKNSSLGNMLDNIPEIGRAHV